MVEASKLREDIESILVREDSSRSLRVFLPRLGEGWLSSMLVSSLVVVCLKDG